VHFTLDLVILTVFVAVQWRVTSSLLGGARRRLRGGTLWAARAGVVAMNCALAVGYAMSLSELVSALGLPSSFSLYAGAFSLFYLALSTALVGSRWALCAVRPWLAPPHADPGRRMLLDMAGAALVTAPFAALGYGAFIQRTDFRVREIDVASPGLDPELDGLRIVHLSDIHLSAFLSEAEFARVVDEANQLRPQLAVVTGDLISSAGDPLDSCLRQIARLRAEAGVFGCLGNHERYASVEDYTTKAAARLGVTFLRSEARLLRFGSAALNLAGVDHQRMGPQAGYLKGAERLTASGAYNLLLSHNPDVFPAAAAKGYHLMLAGHTHGGQVTLEILDQHINPARFITPFVSGLYRNGGAAAYVTRGVGTIGIPARIGAPPEIALLRLRKA
jgi:predicted MPP superfamily phosphohydrolase